MDDYALSLYFCSWDLSFAVIVNGSFADWIGFASVERRFMVRLLMLTACVYCYFNLYERRVMR